MKKSFLIVVIMLIIVSFAVSCGTTTPASPTATSAPAPTTAKTSAPSPAPAATQSAVPKPTGTPSATPTQTAKPAAATPVYGGTVRFVDPSTPSTPLGVPWVSNFAHSCMGTVLEPLFTELDDGTLIPRLATSYKVDSTDLKNTSVTITLRKGVKFSDGTDFNAQVAKWNLDNLIKNGVFASPKYWKSCDIIDDYTIRIPWNKWNNSLMPPFGANMVYMISPTAYEKNGAQWANWNMVGTGPFKQVEFVRDVSLKTVRNENYWDTGKPYLFEADYSFVPEEITRTTLFKTGAADIMNTQGNARVASEFQALGYKITKFAAGASMLIPDSANANSPWSNPKVRMAAEYAIDKEGIAKAFGYGFYAAAYELPSPENMGYNPDVTMRKFDTAKAKQLLAEAGYPNGFKTKIIAPSATNRDIIVAIQSQLGAVGIQVDLDFPEPAKFVTYQQGTWENALIYSTSNQSPNFNQSLGFSFPIPRTNFKSMKNPDNWQDVQYDHNLLLPTLDKKNVQNAVKTLVDDCTVIPVYYTYNMWVVKNNLYGYGLGEDGMRNWTCESTWWGK